jgi:hypothetical protein
MSGEERNLESLIKQPRETLDVEIKDWLNLNKKEHQADLVKAILALANHGGGYIIIGFKEIEEGYKKTEPKKEIKSLYNQDRINGVVERYADPQIHVECYQIKEHPVIVVPGGHKVPIRCVRDGPNRKHVNMNAYYIRRPGPASEKPQTGKEWAELIRRCTLADKEILLEQMRALISTDFENSLEVDDKSSNEEWVKRGQKRFEYRVKESFDDLSNSPFSEGYWRAGYTIVPEISDLTLVELKKRIYKCEGNETGWPIGLLIGGNNTHPYNKTIETWLAEDDYADPGSCDFWKADPNGKFIMFRGYQEDSASWEKNEIGEAFDFIIPIWRIGELLLHAKRFVEEFADINVSLEISVKWTGLNDRYLTSSRPRYLSPNKKSYQNDVTSNIVIENISTIDTNLPELVKKLTTPLYEVFNFFQVPHKTIVKELNNMRGLK